MSKRDRPGRDEPVPVPDPIPGGVADAHTHLDACGGRDPAVLARLLERAAAAGVGPLVTTADDLASARWAAETAGAHAAVLAAVGLHPTRADTLDDAARAELEELTRRPGVVAVGETGLDDYWTTRREDCASLARQREAFAWHIDLAKRRGLPLVIHDRDAHDAIVDVLAAEGAPETVVFHCFSGDLALARRCADQGWRTSFSGTVTFRNAAPLREAAAWVPAELVLTETDAPFLTPHPYRGRPNEPACVPYTVRDLAALRGDDVVELAATTRATADAVFARPASR